jgi:outer membrane receptor protein involved in Fe transport
VLDTYSAANDNDQVKVDTTVIDILPSLNVIYSFHPKMNLRLSGSQTVCRPEARELAPFVFYDFSLFVLTNGNSKLLRTKITNADLKYEFYPVGGQAITLGGFFKWFENPIEKTLFPALSEGRIFTYINVPTAYAWGLELDYRFTIASFLKNNKSRFLENLSFTGNFSYIFSEVNLDTVSYVTGRRPLQGQSPIIVNGLISYDDSKYGFGISLAVNYFGRRIFAVGDVTYPELWENPRVLLDLQLLKSFFAKKLELKLNIRDLLAQDLIFYQDINGDGKLSESGDYELIRQRMSQRISFSVGYKF